MRENIVSLSLIVLCCLALACEKESKNVAGARGTLLSEFGYDGASRVPARVSAVAAVSNVTELTPKEVKPEVLDPAALYLNNCAACHQATGQGVPGAFPPLDGSVYVVSDNTERLAAIMVYGLQGPIKVKGVEYVSAMPGQGVVLDDLKLAAVATYIRSSWSNEAKPIDPETFAAVRKKWGSRGPFSIDELGREE